MQTHRGVYSLLMSTFRDVRFSSYTPATLRRCYYHRAVFVSLPGSHVAPNMQSMHWKTQFLDVWTSYTFVCILVARYPSSFRVPQTLPPQHPVHHPHLSVRLSASPSSLIKYLRRFAGLLLLHISLVSLFLCRCLHGYYNHNVFLGLFG